MLKKRIITAIGAIAVGLGIGLALPIKNNSYNNAVASTVMITTLSGKGGGTGVVVSNSSSESEILTNAHVCSLLKKGGLVIGENGMVTTATKFVLSREHDLCMVVVNTDMGTSATLASKAPDIYTGSSIIGHPALLPTVVTTGHFSGSQIIQVFTGVRKCTEQDFKDNLLVCMFFRGMPIIKTYRAVLSSSTIMPGSSGSAVYNEDYELSGLAFAGSGDLGFAFIVPYEYVASFLSKTLNGKNRDRFTTVNYEQSPEVSILDSGERLETLIERCKRESFPEVEKYCKIINDVRR
jgi:S1-C subfamily serine protease